MPEISDLIKKRVSCRTFADQPVEAETLRKFSELVGAEQTGPFGNKPRFQLINLGNALAGRPKKLGTYGVIKNARIFLVGISKNGAKAMEDYGYCKEILILQATGFGLGTCWLGGTFNAGGFTAAVKRQEGEIIPTVSPLGYPAQERSIAERIMRRVAGSDNRRPWQEMFFAGNFSTSLTPEQAGIYAEVLETLRLAPSASNKQPWRILRQGDDSYHFYLSRAFGYELRGVRLQDIDMGIAMSHFALTARQSGRPAGWIIRTDPPQATSLEYIATWQENVGKNGGVIA
jgi:nitroreductase